MTFMLDFEVNGRKFWVCLDLFDVFRQFVSSGRLFYLAMGRKTHLEQTRWFTINIPLKIWWSQVKGFSRLEGSWGPCSKWKACQDYTM